MLSALVDILLNCPSAIGDTPADNPAVLGDASYPDALLNVI